MRSFNPTSPHFDTNWLTTLLHFDIPTMSTSEATNAIVRPPSRYIAATLVDIQNVLLERFAKQDEENYRALAQLVEAMTEIDFLDLRRRIKYSFHLFSDGALGKPFVGRLGQQPPSKEIFIQRELRLVGDLMTIMHAANYKLLCKELWETALEENFELSMPIKVDLEVMNNKMLTRFWEKRPEERKSLPDITDRLLIFYRGISEGWKEDLFLTEKVDLLSKYLIVDPLRSFWKMLTGKGYPTKVKKDKEKTDDPLVDTVKRVSLTEQLPDSKTIFSRLFKKMEIREPIFDNVVVIYRKQKPTLLPSTPDNYANRTQAKRNVVIKMFDNIPTADLEIVFPEKTVNIRTSSWLIISITSVIALCSAAITLWQTDIEATVVLSTLTVILGKAFQSYTSMQREKATMMSRMSKMLYEKTRDSQEGALLSLLDDMADQTLKGYWVVYTILLLNSGKPMTLEQLDSACVKFFKKEFGLDIDFCIEEKLPRLLSLGFVVEDEDNPDQFVALPLEEAIVKSKRLVHSSHVFLGIVEGEMVWISQAIGMLSSRSIGFPRGVKEYFGR